jgi:hypothetical protein
MMSFEAVTASNRGQIGTRPNAERSFKPIVERRRHRRHDLEAQELTVQRWDSQLGVGRRLGTVVDLSSGGIRIRTSDAGLRRDQQVRIRLTLPSYAGISPFVDISTGAARPKSEWVGWLAVTRVVEMGGGEYEAAGTLIDMEELDRGMLGLYLSTQPLAA